MRGKKFFRYCIYAVILIVFIVTGSLFAYYMIRDHRRVSELRTALSALQEGNDTRAEQLLIGCLKSDQNNETALAKLGELYEKTGQIRNAGTVYLRLVQLNPFNENYQKLRINALYRLRNYPQMIIEIKRLPKDQARHFAGLFAYAHFATGKKDAANALLKKLSPEEQNADHIRYMKMVSNLGQAQNTPGERAKVLKELSTFAESSDKALAVEAKLAMISHYQVADDRVRMETLLKDIAEHAPEAGLALLGDFYYVNHRIPEACAIYTLAAKHGLNAASQLFFAEALLKNKQLDDLVILSKAYQHGNKSTLQQGYYLDALIAYLQGDSAGLGKSFEMLRDTYISPTASLLMLEYAAREKNSKMALIAGTHILSRRNLSSFHATAVGMLKPMIGKLYAEQRFSEAAPLVELIRYSVPNDPIQQHILLLDKQKRGLLTMVDIDTALRQFPNDPSLLELGAVTALRAGNFKTASAMLDKLPKQAEDAQTMFLRSLTLENSGRISEAMTCFRAAMKKYPSDHALLKRFVEFAIRNPQLKLFTEVKELLGGKPSMRTLIPLIEAEELEMIREHASAMKKRQQLYDTQVLHVSRPEDRELLYHVALKLAETNEHKTAIDIYESLIPYAANPLFLYLNLSELYAAEGQQKKALDAANTAWRNNEQHPYAKICYGLRLFENGYFKEAYSLLSDEARSAQATEQIRKAWRRSLEEIIERSFKENQYTDCARYCDILAKKYPDNKVAAEYQTRLKSIKKK